MSYRVELSVQAQEDLARLLESLRDGSPKAAGRLARNFWAATMRLETMPLSCGLARESDLFPEEVRHLLFWVNPRRKYRALFAIRGELVQVLTIRAPGERPVDPSELNG
jgi:hypothetical protein